MISREPRTNKNISNNNQLHTSNKYTHIGVRDYAKVQESRKKKKKKKFNAQLQLRSMVVRAVVACPLPGPRGVEEKRGVGPWGW